MHSLERPPSPYPEKVEPFGGRLLFQLRAAVSGGEPVLGLVNKSFKHHALVVIVGHTRRPDRVNLSILC